MIELVFGENVSNNELDNDLNLVLILRLKFHLLFRKKVLVEEMNSDTIVTNSSEWKFHLFISN